MIEIGGGARSRPGAARGPNTVNGLSPYRESTHNSHRQCPEPLRRAPPVGLWVKFDAELLGYRSLAFFNPQERLPDRADIHSGTPSVTPAPRILTEETT